MAGLRSTLQALNVNVESSVPDHDDPTICPACHKTFKTSRGVHAHLKSAKSCRWYKSGKLRELTLPGSVEELDETQSRTIHVPDPRPAASRAEEEPREVLQEYFDRFDDFIPLEAGPSSSQLEEREANGSRPVEEEDDERVVEEFEGAGQTYLVDETMHQRWRRYFGGEDTEGDITMTDETDERTESGIFQPFSSELEWRFSEWATQEGIGHKSLDRLLAIPEVRSISMLANS